MFNVDSSLSSLEERDYSTQDDPHQLYGQHVIDKMKKKPEFSFLITHYNLLYQSIIPNPRLSINILSQHINISRSVAQYIIDGSSRRVRCQRIINVLLVNLNSVRDYMQFCFQLNTISALTDLPCKMIREFWKNGNWNKAATVHPKLASSLQSYEAESHNSKRPGNVENGTKLVDNTTSDALTMPDNHAAEVLALHCTFDDQISIERTSKCSISCYYQNKRRIRVSKMATIQKQHTPASGVELLRSKYDAILQSLPSDYERTLQAIQDHLTDEQICNVLGSSNSSLANEIILDCITEKMKYDGDMLDVCDQLEKISSTLSDSSVLNSVIRELRKGFQQISDETSSSQPRSLSESQESPTALVRSKYDAILQSMPIDYERTLQVLQDSLTDEQICAILNTSGYSSANKKILDCMIERMSHTGDLLHLCDQLEQIMTASSDSTTVATVISQLKARFQQNFESDVTATENTLLTSSNQVDNYTQSSTTSAVTTCVTCQSTTLTTTTVPSSLTTPEHTRKDKTDTQPQIAELHRDVVPKYAVHWEDLGVMLGLKDYDISVISRNHSFNPNRTIDCCKSMLKKWLETDTGATWGKLRDAINTVNKQGSKSKYMKPPKLSTTTVPRPEILKEMVNKICNTNLNIECYAVALTVTGAGGFGKTTITKALCHDPIIKQQFTNGVVFVELGPRACDPSVKLSQLYHLLTGSQLNSGDTNYAEQEIQQLTEAHYQNLLVIIDDVWHVEDAEPIARAFSYCKTVLTTRMNDTEQYIPTAEKITIGPMKPKEAIGVMTSGIMDYSTLSHEDKILLEELSQEAHLWPLILSLIRGQLLHNIKHCKLSHHDAIHTVQVKLHDKGLTAFDKHNIESVERSRKFAVKICIELTLEYLSQSESDNFKTFILTTGVGNSLPVDVIYCLWNVSKEEAKDKIDILWAYGIIRLIEIIMPLDNKIIQSIEVHAVVSQYIIENIESKEVFPLLPRTLGTLHKLKEELEISFLQSYGVKNIKSLSKVEFLKYTQSKIEHDLMPHFIREIDSRRLYELHFIINEMSKVQFCLEFKPDTHHLLPPFVEQYGLIKAECYKMLKNLHVINRKLSQMIQRHLADKNYCKLLQSIEENCFTHPSGFTAQKCVEIIKGIIQYCDPEQAKIVAKCCLYLHKITPNFDIIRHRYFPYLKLHVKLHEKIVTALDKESPLIESTCDYCNGDEYKEEFDLIHQNYYNRTQGAAASLLN
ncbi:uncharacterized protein [Dysidea avara]